MEDSFDLTCDKFHLKRVWFSITPQRKTCWEQVCFGFVAPLHWVEKNRRLLTGKSSARSLVMIKNDKELEITQERVRQFERQVAQIRKTETDGENYRMSAAGYLAEIDRMNLEIRDYLWSTPTEQSASTA